MAATARERYSQILLLFFLSPFETKFIIPDLFESDFHPPPGRPHHSCIVRCINVSVFFVVQLMVCRRSRYMYNNIHHHALLLGGIREW